MPPLLYVEFQAVEAHAVAPSSTAFHAPRHHSIRRVERDKPCRCTTEHKEAHCLSVANAPQHRRWLLDISIVRTLHTMMARHQPSSQTPCPGKITPYRLLLIDGRNRHCPD